MARSFLFADTMHGQHPGAAQHQRLSPQTSRWSTTTKHGITPTSVKRAVQASLQLVQASGYRWRRAARDRAGATRARCDPASWKAKWPRPRAKLEYERAALLRDQIRELKKQSGMGDDMSQPQAKVDYREALKKKRAGKRGA